MRRILRVWRMSRNDLRLVWLALRHPNRPTWLLPATLALGFFTLEPFNFAIPVLGVVDDLFLLPLLLHGFARMAVYVTTLPSSSRSRDDRVVLPSDQSDAPVRCHLHHCHALLRSLTCRITVTKTCGTRLFRRFSRLDTRRCHILEPQRSLHMGTPQETEFLAR
jgi:uncharacterized membrane protein YkvA (DUF1232 family)